MDWFSYLMKYSRKKVVFPFYHAVSEEACPHIRNLYPVKSVAQFERELDFFQKYFSPLTVEELISLTQKEKEPERPSFLLTFDDGLRQCIDVIAPILKERNLPAIFFVNTGFIGNQDLFFRYKVSLLIEHLKQQEIVTPVSVKGLLSYRYADRFKIDDLALKLGVDFKKFLKEYQPYLTWEEVRQLAEDGFIIGAHSIDHPLYEDLDLAEQKRQTEQSIRKVQEEVGTDLKLFSFPFTDYGVSQDFFNWIQKEKIYDLTFGTAGIKTDAVPTNIQRLPMDDCLGDPAHFLAKNILAFHLKKVIAREKVVHP